MARKRDVIGEFYDLLEEMGESCAFYIGRYCLGMTDPEWTQFRHQEYDGITAFAHLLRTRDNIDIDIRTSPNPPSSWAIFVAFLRLLVLGMGKRQPMRWRRFDESWRPLPASASRPKAHAWVVFSKEETRQLTELARSRGASLQAWLLWALKEAILPELVPGTGVVSWHVPVNMHGAFPSEGERGNCNFSLEVTFPPDAGPEAIHKAIRKELRLRRHWVLAKMTFLFGPKLWPWLLRRAVKSSLVGKPWQGVFSCSGAVAPENEAEGDKDEWFIGLNPTVRASPLGACCVEWRDRLSLAIRIHPSLTTDPQVARDWMASWRKFAEGGEARSAADAPQKASARFGSAALFLG